MRIVIHHTKFYDWEPVPRNTLVTPNDIASRKVKADGSGWWLMPITKAPEGGTHTQVNLPEEQVIAKIIDDKTRPAGGRTLTRKEAVAMYMSEHILPSHSHRAWLTGVEVHDDGPDEAMARAMLLPHTVAETSRVNACKNSGKHAYAKGKEKDPNVCGICGHQEGAETADSPNIDPADVEDHITAYTEPLDAEGLAEHLRVHFKLKPNPTTKAAV